MESLVDVSDQELRIDFAPNFKCRANVRPRSLCATSPLAFQSPNLFTPRVHGQPSQRTHPSLILRHLRDHPQVPGPTPPGLPSLPSDHFLIKTAQFPTSPGPVHHSAADLGSQAHSRLVGPFLLRHAAGRGEYDARNIIKRQKSILSELRPRDSESLPRVAT